MMSDGQSPKLRQKDSVRSQTYRERSWRNVRRLRSASLSYPHHNSVGSYITESLRSVEEIDIDKVPWWTSKRVCLSLTCFLGFFFLYAQRVNLSIAIVCMVKSESSEDGLQLGNNQTYLWENSSNLTIPLTSTQESIQSQRKVCPSMQSAEAIMGEFLWDKSIQGVILGAFFWGYTAMQIPSGVLSECFGPRLMIAVGMVTVSLMTILTPVLARGSPYLLIATRILIGIGEATMYPGAQVLWSKWSPPTERSRLVGFAFGGCQLGNALAFPISSLFCEYTGWPSIFYTLGACSFAWSILWFALVRDSPAEMKSISDIERKYIETSLEVHVDNDIKKRTKMQHKPWKSILTSLPVWAILVANACGNYGAYMLLTQMPTYLNEILKFDIKSNGLYSMIPYLLFWVVIILAGILADTLISRDILSIKWTRKISCGIGHFIPAAFLVAVGYMDCWHQLEAVLLLTLSLGFCGFQFASVFVNHGDIAPKFAGTIFGITNTGASIPGIVAPYVVAFITVNKTQEEWLTAFYIAAVVYCLGAIFFMIFADGSVQPWAKDSNTDTADGACAVNLNEGVDLQDDVFDHT